MRKMPGGGPPEGGSWPDDLKLMYESPSGHRVWKEVGWKQSKGGREGAIARHLADNGFDVLLRKELRFEGTKTPDCYLVSDERVEDWEFKRVYMGAKPARSVQDAVDRTIGQCSRVAIFLDMPDIPMYAVNLGIVNGLRQDDAQFIEDVAIIRNDGSVQRLTRQEFDDGKRF